MFIIFLSDKQKIKKGKTLDILASLVYNFFMGKMTNKMAEVEQKKPDEKEGVKIEPYKVFGRDFSLTDPDYIKYYKVRMNIMAVRYQLLGRVNKNGVYQIPAVIKQELVGMFKEIEDMDHDWYRASAVYMKNIIIFKLNLLCLKIIWQKHLYIYQNL